jgi:hypothetical protein
MVVMVMVIIPTPAHGPHQEEADPPPATVLHGLSSLYHPQRSTVFSTTGMRLPPVCRAFLALPHSRNVSHARTRAWS